MKAQPKISRAEFAFLIRRAGLTLSDAQLAELYAPYGTLEQLIERLHAPLGPEIEPTPIVSLEDLAR